MEEDVSLIVGMTEENMKESLEHLQKELVRVRTGRASTAMLDGVLVNYYGNPTPLKQVANVNTSDARTIEIKPWEKSMVGPIERAIFEANFGITPQNDGELIRLIIPPLTEERRRDLVKQVKGLGEDAKISIRNARRDAMNDIRKEVKNGYPEDAGKRKEDEIQDLTNTYTNKVDKMLEVKEQDIMTI
ncbi:ribosome recycling factor [Flavilitoribacter nigricans]|uniref:Ribosome-recycling factor n=1 Tax=Flavilitoribacter nigricans (strain ATCC 23147 / DSM 23189 / NBRC 102662 / NCIMB 1420 / SS-2) TaxID=1122177 RepID=A0A2D0NHX4_FLAN2|nr:ribosome recycling factor [Flavilitoribacter nigricans]PHN08081.1 ribosome recycling factor [Flavilitoribacter nigricans DSM 23189 = NBRC 102662]